MNKFKVWKIEYTDMSHNGGIFVRAETPDEAIKLGNKVVVKLEKFRPEHFSGLELVSVVWEDK